jgi:hypothetical protein
MICFLIDLITELNADDSARNRIRSHFLILGVHHIFTLDLPIENLVFPKETPRQKQIGQQDRRQLSAH